MVLSPCFSRFLKKGFCLCPVNYYRMVLNVLAMLYSRNYSNDFLLYAKGNKEKLYKDKLHVSKAKFKSVINMCN